MLQIQNIRKTYVTGDLLQTALDGVSLTLRDNEFVAILGPSGSGKTTLLNVIGGLDRYDSGDLIINGISTQEYTDRDWDSYRNHTIGFVFQSYNLIPHQTVLANVELALTISGISKSERKKRAIKALEDVGLGNQIHKKPNQMSGGQMQRVAIARALVNNPDILLADEPTGALDSETSVQVMELLKEVSKDRLVVMVTHNPELAEEYANRIVRVKDGRILDDTNPFVSDKAAEPPRHQNMGKSSMSFITALTLSFNNLWTKKGRTLLTAFAGSIGIIGIALIMSLSTGFQAYIDKIQEDTLSNYPLSFQSESTDMSAYISGLASSMAASSSAPDGTVVEQQVISQMFEQVGSNDLTSFKAHLDKHYDEIEHTINAIKYSYGVKPQIFAEDTSEEIIQVNPSALFSRITGSSAMSAYMDSDIFYEMMENYNVLESQYDVLQGRWPEAYNEMILVLQDPSQISDYMTYALGLRDASQLEDMIASVMAGNEVEVTTDPMEWTYDDLMNLKFRLVDASSCYRYNEEYGVWEDMSDDLSFMQSVIEDGETLTIVGIICPKEGVSATTLTAGIAYTHELTEYVINKAAESEIVKLQTEDPSIDVFTGKPFGSDEDSGLSFDNMISVDEDALSSAFGMNISTEGMMDLLEKYLQKAVSSISIDTEPAQQDFLDTLSAMSTEMLNYYITANAGSSGEAVIALDDIEAMVDGYMESSHASNQINALVKTYEVDAQTFSKVYRPLLTGLVTTYVAAEIAQNYVEESVPETTEPEETTPEFTFPEFSLPEFTLPDFTVPGAEETEGTEPETTGTVEQTSSESAGYRVELLSNTVTSSDFSLNIDLSDYYATITAADVEEMVSSYVSSTIVKGTAGAIATQMVRADFQRQINKILSGFGTVLSNYIGNAFYVDQEAIAAAFQFNMTQEELTRLMTAMSTGNQEQNASANLKSLGYADFDSPTTISVYFIDFAAKEEFISFVDAYNDDMEARGKEDQVISYTDLTGIMMSSVRTIIDSVSYVLIAFVSVSLIVSSIMIGIITYISVMERTKEIGVLRAIGASKRNISQVFNAETFIIGMCSGLLGVGVTLSLIPLINYIIHSVTGNMDINAQLPVLNATVLILLSMVLTIIGGLIPSKKAAQKDPVIALRSE